MDADDGPGVESAPVATSRLADGRELTVRHAVPADVDDVMGLYERLSPDDCLLRFFTARPPSRSFTERWLSGSTGGSGVVLLGYVCAEGEAPRLVAEAGYSVLENGEGELGLTIDPTWRGWLGPWMFAHLLAVAAERGVPNVVAIVKPINRRMLAVLRHRRSVVVDHSDVDEIALVVSTTGSTAGWPADGDRPRILVEASSGSWTAEQAARDGGFEVRTCRGPGPGRPCPITRGESCPLVDGADVVVDLLPSDRDGAAEILAHHLGRPDVHLVVPSGPSLPEAGSCDDASAVIESIRATLGLA